MRKRHFTGVLPFSVFRTEKNDSKIINIKILKKYEVVLALVICIVIRKFYPILTPNFFPNTESDTKTALTRSTQMPNLRFISEREILSMYKR